MIVSHAGSGRLLMAAAAATLAVGSCWGQSSSVHLTKPDQASALRPRPASFGVSVNQAAGQVDPEKLPPAAFDVVFDVPIFPGSFTAADLIQNGSATIDGWTITNPSGDARTFRVEADVPAPGGTVIPTIAAGSVGTQGACSAASVTPGLACGADDECVGGACGGATQNMSSVSVDNSVTITYSLLDCDSLTYLFVAGWSPPKIRTYCVEAGGVLELKHTADAPGDNRDLAADAAGLHLYYADSNLTKYVISTDGSLTASGSAPVGAGAFDDLAFGPQGRYLYGTHSSGGGEAGSEGSLRVFDTAVLPLPAQIQAEPGLVSPHGVALSANGNRLYVANQWSFIGGSDTDPEEIVIYDRAADGTVSFFGQTAYVARADYFAVHPTLPLLYSTDRPGGSVTTSAVGGGGLAYVDSTFSGFGATQLALGADGSRLYVLNINEDEVAVFAVDGGGDLTLLETELTGARPEHLILHPDGNLLFVAGAGDFGGSSTISVYGIDGGGFLDLLSTETVPDQGAYRMEIVDLN